MEMYLNLTNEKYLKFFIGLLNDPTISEFVLISPDEFEYTISIVRDGNYYSIVYPDESYDILETQSDLIETLLMLSDEFIYSGG
jgi:hypothetical protein